MPSCLLARVQTCSITYNFFSSSFFVGNVQHRLVVVSLIILHFSFWMEKKTSSLLFTLGSPKSCCENGVSLLELSLHDFVPDTHEELCSVSVPAPPERREREKNHVCMLPHTHTRREKSTTVVLHSVPTLHVKNTKKKGFVCCWSHHFSALFPTFSPLDIFWKSFSGIPDDDDDENDDPGRQTVIHDVPVYCVHILCLKNMYRYAFTPAYFSGWKYLVLSLFLFHLWNVLCRRPRKKL